LSHEPKEQRDPFHVIMVGRLCQWFGRSLLRVHFTLGANLVDDVGRPPPQPSPAAGEGVLLPLSASERGLGGEVCPKIEILPEKLR
jgi:hypothetical protein